VNAGDRQGVSMIQLEYSGTLKVSERMKQISRKGIEIINFASGTLKDTPRAVIEATKEAIEEGMGATLTEVAGLLELREVIAKKLAEEDCVHVDPVSQVIVTAGAKGAILEAFQAVLKPGDEVLVPDPYWTSYKPLVILSGAVPKMVPLRKEEHFRLDANNIRREITPRSKMLILNTPHNPTGRVFTKSEIQAVCNIAIEHDLLVLSDESYKELVFDNYKHYSIASFPGMGERTIIVYSFGKAYNMYGWRIGYAASNNEEIIRRMLAIQSNSVSCATSFAQRGALAAFTQAQEYLQKTVKTLKKLCYITLERLNKIDGVSCEEPEEGYCIFPDFSKISESADELADYLLEEGGIASTPGSAFGNVGKAHIRINYRHEEPYLIKGLEKLEKTIKSYINR
jgi:aspartate/methionine/tyrosine aminotransferase